MSLHLAVCELYNPNVHGISLHPPTDIQYQYIVRDVISLEEFIALDHKPLINELKYFYRTRLPYINNHPTISNYNAITKSPKYIDINIVKISYKTGRDGLDWSTACLKTFYIRLIQRIWKRKLNQRKAYISFCKQLQSLCYRETHGRFIR